MITKDAADYGRGMPRAHCAICRHFVRPDRCERVIGRVAPGGWCRLFVAKKQEKDKAA